MHGPKAMLCALHDFEGFQMLLCRAFQSFRLLFVFIAMGEVGIECTVLHAIQ